MNNLDYDNEIREKYNIITGKRNILIIGTPNHGNLGDQAIWYATQGVTERFFQDANVVDINIGDFWADIGAIVNLIGDQDIIILQGGGNFGNYYMDDEMIRRCVVTCFPDNRLIMFPQTIYFTDDEIGRAEMKKSIRIYGNHKNLVLFARDSYSCQVMKEHFKNAVFALPDVVLTLNYTDRNKKREGILFCIRSDTESIMSDETIRQMEKFFSQKGKNVRFTDTQVENYTKARRERLLIDKIEEFQKAQLVVTDRLHGMIFSIITGTPCIVFDNFNSKISNAYRDLDGLDYVKMVSGTDELANAYELLNSRVGNSYNERPVIEQFGRILEEIMYQLPVQKQEQNVHDQDLVESISSVSLKLMASKQYMDERVRELAEYKDWVNNLQRQNVELLSEVNAMRDRERQWNIQQRELYQCIKSEREKNAKWRLGSRK